MTNANTDYDYVDDRPENEVPFSTNSKYFVHDVSQTKVKPKQDIASEEDDDEDEDDEADEDVFPHKPQPLKRPEEVEDKPKEKEIEDDFISKYGAKAALVGIGVMFIVMVTYLFSKNKNSEIPGLLDKWNADNNGRYDYLVSCITDALKHKPFAPLEAKADWLQYLNENGLQNKEYDVIHSGNKVKLGNIGITEDWRVKRDLMGNVQQVYKNREFIT